MLERFFQWLIPNERSELRARRAHVAQVVIGITALAASLFLAYALSHPLILSPSEWNWLLLAGGVVWAYSVAADIRSSSTNPSSYFRGDKYAYKRSADPVGYWIVIALQVAAVAGLVVTSLGGLLGLWK